MNVCGGGNDDDDVGGVDVERNAVVALPLPSRCIGSPVVLDMMQAILQVRFYNYIYFIQYFFYMI